MVRTEFVSRFNDLYLGDSLLQSVEFKIPEAECRLTFSAGKVLKAGGGSIFEAEARFAPALLRLQGVSRKRSSSVPPRGTLAAESSPGLWSIVSE
ncbi:hypothetical protein [Myxococcus stipitatus]|uniref:hypothetical protein n=1 Tax=Myxococcus stipitatus TaxID=83455 RepID=UPI0030D32640